MKSKIKFCVVPSWYLICLFFQVETAPYWARTSSLSRFHDYTQNTTFGKSPLDEWSAPSCYLYLTTHNSERDRYPSRRWNSNPQYRQAGGFSPTP